MATLEQKERILKSLLRRYGSAVIAFSGGVDSSVLLAAATKALPGPSVFAVTARSSTYPASELSVARAIAHKLKARHRIIKSQEFSNPRFVANPSRRCYFCKSALFSELRQIAQEEGLAVVLDGTNYDDRGDFRPGRKAGQECGVQSPLLAARLTKQNLRTLARRYGLPNWNKPAAACLASRVPYGTSLSRKLLARIDRAENVLRRMGFTQIRVRDHTPIARIEIEPREFVRMIKPQITRRIVAALQHLGYQYVTLDLAGYRTGSMNEPSKPRPLVRNAERRLLNRRARRESDIR